MHSFYNVQRKNVIRSLFATLLLTIPIWGNDLESLNQAWNETNDHLAAIEKMIEEKEVIIDRILNNHIELASLVKSGLTEEQITTFYQEINRIEMIAYEVVSGDSDMSLLFNQVFFKECDFNKKELERIKFSMIRYSVENYLLQKLFVEYEECLQQLVKIQNNLKSTN